jgi:copper homeostasis protein
MMRPFLLEVCAFNIQSCHVAMRAGAGRIELCDNPQEGGTTPSFGLIKTVREQLPDMVLFPIIRPRGGHFLYDVDELEVIRNDIEMCRELHCDGISTGMEKQNGEIDIKLMKRVVEWAYPMQVTCHRVFDRTPDPFKALEDIISAGCTRILTSGQQVNAPMGAELLKKLVAAAGDRIIIMPGGGVRAANITQLIQYTGASEFHTAAKNTVPDIIPNEHPSVLDAGSMVLSDEAEIADMVKAGKSMYGGLL